MARSFNDWRGQRYTLERVPPAERMAKWDSGYRLVGPRGAKYALWYRVSGKTMFLTNAGEKRTARGGIPMTVPKHLERLTFFVHKRKLYGLNTSNWNAPPIAFWEGRKPDEAQEKEIISAYNSMVRKAREVKAQKKEASMNLDNIIKKSAGKLDPLVAILKVFGKDCNCGRQGAETGLGHPEPTEPITAEMRHNKELAEDDPGKNLTEFFPEYDDRNDAANNRADEGDKVGFLASASPFTDVEYDDDTTTLAFRARATGKRYLYRGVRLSSARQFEKHNAAGRGRSALASVKGDVLRYRSEQRSGFSIPTQHVVVNWPK